MRGKARIGAGDRQPGQALIGGLGASDLAHGPHEPWATIAASHHRPGMEGVWGRTRQGRRTLRGMCQSDVWRGSCTTRSGPVWSSETASADTGTMRSGGDNAGIRDQTSLCQIASRVELDQIAIALVSIGTPHHTRTPALPASSTGLTAPHKQLIRTRAHRTVYQVRKRFSDGRGAARVDKEGDINISFPKRPPTPPAGTSKIASSGAASGSGSGPSTSREGVDGSSTGHGDDNDGYGDTVDVDMEDDSAHQQGGNEAWRFLLAGGIAGAGELICSAMRSVLMAGDVRCGQGNKEGDLSSWARGLGGGWQTTVKDSESP